jgi:hypothetical protein
LGECRLCAAWRFEWAQALYNLKIWVDAGPAQPVDLDGCRLAQLVDLSRYRPVQLVDLDGYRSADSDECKIIQLIDLSKCRPV